jgi:DNA-directed RNA polymerase subunit L
MVNHVAAYGNTLSLYFDSVEGKILFKSRVEGLKGITIEKEGYKTLKLKVEDQTLLESLRENLKKREGLKIDLKIEDLHSYLSTFINHPALKLAFTVIHTIIELKS